ncbi:(3R)-hydroxymyristoyl-ACP dehydratase FabZ [Helicobacter sp. NHP19-012]|uniref:3-hydroxyacyl-[acyl-carrier-protein] dehydratase FabZ n=1 Tax=Helicobacter gastrofelis TaxID=2849642 RepID=A0ABM7SFY3_9HELI|nr:MULTISPECIES: 3-hydroxyacyl-ACP dehydratase FabZ [unclassified Helicobacter]BCZ19791.1 (3R)-hydroxymyristoyl-ACP dehydratase FabZ [Helicobacter sp. NHP19-012]GMB95468.1 (3R)-hydroxymyristoyl-ACP dehydratase FabZ [Helicobacter sp. NHP22-001]
MSQEGLHLDLDIHMISAILPHRYPFLLVDRVLRLEPYKEVHAYKNITYNEEVFMGHFPGKPIYPGVLIVEGMAQAGGLLAFVSLFGADPEVAATKIVYFMTIDRVKFRNPVIPGDQLHYHLSEQKHKGMIWQVGGVAKVGDKVVAEAELKAMIVDRKEDK